MHRKKTRGNRSKLQKGKCPLDVRKKDFTRVFKGWERLSREAVQSPSLEIDTQNSAGPNFSASSALFWE